MDEEILKQFALANLSMLAQAAAGEYQPKPGEVDERLTWLTDYLLTGRGLVTPEGMELAAKLRAALATPQALAVEI